MDPTLGRTHSAASRPGIAGAPSRARPARGLSLKSAATRAGAGREFTYTTVQAGYPGFESAVLAAAAAPANSASIAARHGAKAAAPPSCGSILGGSLVAWQLRRERRRVIPGLGLGASGTDK